jgi:leader peptidase (prepilin peptidase)/N-methyltransferase
VATNLVVFGIGLILGSLLNVVIIRLPREQRLLGMPRCTRTGKALAWWQLVPVVGWLLQRGKARNGQPLHWIYPFVELLTAVMVLRFSQTYGFSLLFFYLCFVGVVLIITGAIDWLHRYIYTFFILGAALLVFVVNALGFIPHMNILNAGVGMLVGGIGFLLLFVFAQFLFPSKSVPFGLGDVFLAIFIGAAFGLTRLIPTLSDGMFMAGFAALLIIAAKYILRRRVPEYMSYGTYLCLGAILFLFVQGW